MIARFERYLYLVLIVGLAVFYTRQAPTRADVMVGFQEGFSGIVERVSPAVVNISAEGTVNRSPMGNPFQGTPFQDFFNQFFGQQRKQNFTSLGSGIIVRSDGYILTNAHVIENANKISIILNSGKTYSAKLIGTDPRYDLAVLKVTPEERLPQGTLGNSDAVKVGDWAIAIGNPYGFKSTVTVGVISAKGRDLPVQSEATYHNLIQTDAAINPGNSGGALADINGDIIGMNTAIASPSGGAVGLGFAIPSNLIKAELNQLITTGKVEHSFLGIYSQALTPNLMKAFGVDYGVLVADVIPDSPAAGAGLKHGDVILKVNGKKMDSPETLQDAISLSPVGTVVDLEVVRNKHTVMIPVKLRELTAQSVPAKAENAALLGLHLKAITPEDVQYYHLTRKSGVLVTAVDPNSAISAYIAPGDIIVEANRRPVKSVHELEQAIQSNSNGSVLLLVDRQGMLRYVDVNQNG